MATANSDGRLRNGRKPHHWTDDENNEPQDSNGNRTEDEQMASAQKNAKKFSSRSDPSFSRQAGPYSQLSENPEILQDRNLTANRGNQTSQQNLSASPPQLSNAQRSIIAPGTPSTSVPFSAHGKRKCKLFFR